MTQVARFAPTPSGRMHLGNLFAALLCWLDARQQGAELVLRIENLDEVRCRPAYTAQLCDDLRWLGLDWDRGYPEAGYLQSERKAQYQTALQVLQEKGLCYPCYCSRKDLLAVRAPHQSDGTHRYAGTCRTLTKAQRNTRDAQGRCPAWRVRVPDETLSFVDGNFGRYAENLQAVTGDFILRRSDGVFAYQLAVVVDDALMGVNRVVRGSDLLPSTARQIWLFRALGYEAPQYIHTPLLTDAQGRRLAKRDKDLDMATLREQYSPEALLGILAHRAGLIDRPDTISLSELLPQFSWEHIGQNNKIVTSEP